MNERYTKLFSLQNNLYAEGSPVIIAAGALLKDNPTNTVLAQLKFQNISKTSVKALTVEIAASDTLGNRIGDMIEYQYLDLSAARNDYFGQKTPIKLPDNKTRSFSVRVTEVIFSDNTVWTSNNNQWEPLKTQPTLETALEDMQLAKQYRIQYGSSCIYMPTKEKDLWICACGTINHNNESRCCKCGNTADTIFSVDIDKLKVACDERIETEKKKAAEDAKKAAKLTKQIAIITVIAIVIITSICLVVSHNKKQSTYNHAVELMKSDKYQEAMEVFDSLGDYKREEIDGILYIGEYLIKADSSVTSCNIREGTKIIGDKAFYWCRNLTSVTIPNSVTSIGSNAFEGCANLTSVTIQDGVTSIRDYAFAYCSELSNITIPSSVTSIGNYAFAYCTGLINITIPNNVTSIGNWAFYDCISLTDVTIPNRITNIDNGTFNQCRSLTNITIPNNVTSIDTDAFNGCSSLTSVTIPDSVTSIDRDAFNICENLTTVYYKGSEESWNSIFISHYNSALKNAQIIYNYTGE